MAKKNFGVDIDLNNNQLLNATIQNLSVAPTVTGRIPGFIYWNTTEKTAYVFTGLASPNQWLNLGQLYTHNTQAALAPTLSGNNVLATLTFNTEGHVVAATSRTLTLADLGYTGAANANFYVHPSFTGNGLAGAPLAGTTVISNVIVNSEGHVTGMSTRSLTNADLSALIINDAATNATFTWSSTKIAAELAAINNTITGGLINKGGYDAATNTPLLDATPIAGIKNGWAYVVTAAGAFFTENVQIGDMIIAKQDNPTTLAHWTTVNKNIADIVSASTSVQGIVQLATDAETIAGVDATKAVTPASLQSKVATETAIGLIAIATQAEVTTGTDNVKAITALKLKNHLSSLVGGFAATFGDGVAISFNITHGLNTTDVSVTIMEVATGEQIEMQVRATSTTIVNVQCNVAPALNQYRVIIKK